MTQNKFTLPGIRALQPGEIAWDTRITGLGCRRQKDKRVFILKYRFHGRQRLYTIGPFGDDLTPELARDKAKELWELVRKDIDPAAQKKAAKKLPIVKDAFKSYLEEVNAKRSKKTHESYKWLYEKIIEKELGNYRVDAVARADVARLHNKLKDKPYQGNRTLALLSSFFSWCEKHGHKPEGNHPCRHIEKYKEKARERFLSEEELYSLGKALAKYERDYKYMKEHPHKKEKEKKKQEDLITLYATAAIRLLILTGARSGEILSLKWEDVDFKNKIIRLQESKTGQKTIHLSAPALQILQEIPRIEDNPYVICGKKDGTHLINIKDPWTEIREIADLDDVRIHDLRHNYASTAVTTGHHLKVIGSLLGHADTKTTERYAHLANDPLQTANEAISGRILEAMTKKPKTNNIVRLKKAG